MQPFNSSHYPPTPFHFASAFDATIPGASPSFAPPVAATPAADTTPATAPSPSDAATTKPKPVVEHRPIVITDQLKIDRYKALLDEKHKVKTEIGLPIQDGHNGLLIVPFEMELDLNTFLTEASAVITGAGYPVKFVQFKGGVVENIFQENPAKLADIDISFVLEELHNGGTIPQWQEIHEVLYRYMEVRAGFKFHFSDDGKHIVYTFKDGTKYTLNSKQSILEFIKPPILWSWFLPKAIPPRERYSLVTLETDKCTFDFEILSSHEYSSISSYDSRRMRYALVEGVPTIFIECVDGWEPKDVQRLRNKRIFRCIPDNIHKFRDGLLRYCSLLTKGLFPQDKSYEKKFCAAFISNEEARKGFEFKIKKYLNDHTTTPEQRIRYLLNFEEILSRHSLHDTEAYNMRLSIAEILWDELRLPNVGMNEKALEQMQWIREYLYWRDEDSLDIRKYRTGPLCRVDDPRGRSFGSLIMQSPTNILERVKQRLDFSIALEAVHNMFKDPNDKTEVKAFFERQLKKIEQRVEKLVTKPAKPSPSAITCFKDFLDFYDKNSQRNPVKLAKKLTNLFLTGAQIDEHQHVIQKITHNLVIVVLKEDCKVACELFKATMSSQLYSAQQLGSLIPNVIDQLIGTQNGYLAVLDLCNAFIGIQELGPKSHFDLIIKLLNYKLEDKQKVHYHRTLDLIAKINWKSEKPIDQLEGWKQLLDTLLRNKDNHPFLLAKFVRLLCKFTADQSGSREVIEQYCEPICKAVFTVIRQDDMQGMTWAHEIEQAIDSPALNKLKMGCSEFIHAEVTKGSNGINSYYLKAEGTLMLPAHAKKYIMYFVAFLTNTKGTSDELEAIQRNQAIQRGLQYILEGSFTAEEIGPVYKILNQAAENNKLPTVLRSLYSRLQQKIEPPKKKEEPPALSAHLEQFNKTKASETSLISKCIDIIKQTLTLETPDALTLQDGLKFLEAAISCGQPSRTEGVTFQKQYKNPRQLQIMQDLHNDLVRFTKWNSADARRLETCGKDLEEIREGCKPKKDVAEAASDTAITEPLFPTLNHATRLTLAGSGILPDQIARWEQALKDNPDNLPIKFTLMNAYYCHNDGVKLTTLGHCLLGEKLSEIHQSQIHNLIGWGYAFQGEVDSVLEHLRKSESFRLRREKEEYILGRQDLLIAYLLTSQWSECLQVLNDLKKKFPGKFGESLAEKLATLCQNSQFSKALELLESQTNAYFFKGEALKLHLLGTIAHLAGKKKKSTTYFAQAKAKLPAPHHKMDAQVILYFNLGKYDQAIECIKKAKTQPFYKDHCYMIHTNLARAYYMMSEWVSSISEYAKIYHINIDQFEKTDARWVILACQKFFERISYPGNFANSSQSIIMIRLALQKILRALDSHKESESLKKPYAELLNQLDQIETETLSAYLLELNDAHPGDLSPFISGVRLLEYLLKKDNIPPQAHKLLQVLKKGDYHRNLLSSLKLCEEALEPIKADSSHEDFMQFIKEVDDKSPEHSQKLISEYEVMLRSNPSGTLQIWTKLLCLYDKVNNPDKVMECYDHVREQGGKVEKHLAEIYRGRAYLRKGYFKQALQCYEVAHTLLPSEKTKFLVADLLVFVGWVRETDFIAQLQMADDPIVKSASFQQTLRLTELARDGQYNEAIKAILSQSQVTPKELYYLGKLYEIVRNVPKAIKVYERLNAAFPNTPHFLRNLGDLYLKNDQKEQALETYKKLVLTPEKGPFSALEEFNKALKSAGEIYFEKENWYEAVWHFALALSRCDKYREIEDHLVNPSFIIALLKYIIVIRNDPTGVDKEKGERLQTTLISALKLIHDKEATPKNYHYITIIQPFYDNLVELLPIANRVYLHRDPKNERSTCDPLLLKWVYEMRTFIANLFIINQDKRISCQISCLKEASALLVGEDDKKTHEEHTREVRKSAVEHLDFLISSHVKDASETRMKIKTLEVVWKVIDENLEEWKNLKGSQLSNIKTALRICQQFDLPEVLAKRVEAFLQLPE